MKKQMRKRFGLPYFRVPVQTDSDSEEERDVQQPLAKQKRAAAEQRKWTEINRWGHSDSSDDDILVSNFYSQLEGIR